jgi:hypothetical protein
MIEYIIRDTEHDKEQRGEAQAVCLLTAGEPVEGREDTVAHGCVYYGPDRSHDLAEAFTSAALKRPARVLRLIYVQLHNKMTQDKDFAMKMARLSLGDLADLFGELSDAGKKEVETDPDFLELMRDSGMWDGEDEHG